jgi:hypothetical protein
MVILPSFVGESAVRLHPESGDTEMEKVDKVFLTYAIAGENIYFATQPPKPAKKPEEVAVTVTTVEFPKSLALQLYSLWSKMLLRTRYSEEPANVTTDGTLIEFAWEKIGWGYLYGQAWFPTRAKSALLFSDLGQALMDFAKSAPKDRVAEAKKIEEAAAKLEEYLRKHSG